MLNLGGFGGGGKGFFAQWLDRYALRVTRYARRSVREPALTKDCLSATGRVAFRCDQDISRRDHRQRG